MASCAVATCRNTYRNTKGRGIIFHAFPKKNLLLTKKWLLQCRRQDYVNENHARVCSEHFLASDYEDDMRNRLLGLPQKKLLKSDAVPTVNLPCTVKEIIQERKGKKTENIREKKSKLKQIASKTQHRSLKRPKKIHSEAEYETDADNNKSNVTSERLHQSPNKILSEADYETEADNNKSNVTSERLHQSPKRPKKIYSEAEYETDADNDKSNVTSEKLHQSPKRPKKIHSEAEYETDADNNKSSVSERFHQCPKKIHSKAEYEPNNKTNVTSERLHQIPKRPKKIHSEAEYETNADNNKPNVTSERLHQNPKRPKKIYSEAEYETNANNNKPNGTSERLHQSPKRPRKIHFEAEYEADDDTNKSSVNDSEIKLTNDDRNISECPTCKDKQECIDNMKDKIISLENHIEVLKNEKKKHFVMFVQRQKEWTTSRKKFLAEIRELKSQIAKLTGKKSTD
ncbi:peroxynitrite isomerase THAP4-like [Stegodyphus dumicola]|uniref:peroxynitrite isomerase THAP4-like n=1 Tax=Stegodyphus dumicola TaxID=202533 RepID=UPI0015AA363C|nr:peroxynitrite isomerase THAP4-like [Stegodyphus dumicola]XP_035216123.1 peroxynitrite isomerase THAP4-like [Stegodyphus dumicola]